MNVSVEVYEFLLIQPLFSAPMEAGAATAAAVAEEASLLTQSQPAAALVS